MARKNPKYRPDELAMQHIPALYEDHHRWLQDWLRRKVGCSADAADLAHDTFFRLIRSPLQESPQHPRRFLVTIAKGLVIDLFRRRSLEQQYLEMLALLPEPEWPSEEARALIVETLLLVDAMLAGLGSKVREVFILSQFDGKNYADIAAQLGLSLRTVNNYMARAIEHCCLFRMQHAVDV